METLKALATASTQPAFSPEGAPVGPGDASPQPHGDSTPQRRCRHRGGGSKQARPPPPGRQLVPTSGTVAWPSPSELAKRPHWACPPDSAASLESEPRIQEPPPREQNTTLCAGMSGLKRRRPPTCCDVTSFPLFNPTSEKATKVQDIKNNLKEAIEVGAWVLSRPAAPPAPRQSRPLTAC